MAELNYPYIYDVDIPEVMTDKKDACYCGCACQIEGPPYTETLRGADQAAQWDYAAT